MWHCLPFCPPLGTCRGLVLAMSMALLAGCPDGTPDGGPPPRDAGVVDDFHDPISMPETPTLDTSPFALSADCAQCHTNHYEEWRGSMHAYAMVDPVFRAIVGVRQADFNGTQDQFCTQCHTPVGTRAGKVVDNFDFDALDPVSLDGVGCATCHKVTEIHRPYNAGQIITPEAPMQGPISDPAANNFHASAVNPIFDESTFCAACHDVVEVSGLNIERPFAEWTESPAAAAGRNCQSCHMPEYDGIAAWNAPPREGLHKHTFTGVDVPMLDGFVSDERKDEIRAEVQALLDGSISLRIDGAAGVVPGDQFDLFITVQNEIDAHNFPTGSTNIRQSWLEVSVTDANGTVLYESGTLDDNGDLKDAFSAISPYGDNDLIKLSSDFIDDFGNPEIFSWRATEHISRSLSPLYERTYTRFVPTEAALVGPLDVTVRARFRSHGPYLLRALGLETYIDDLIVYDIASATRTVELVTDNSGEDAGPVVVDAGTLTPDGGSNMLDAGALGPDDDGGDQTDGGTSTDAANATPDDAGTQDAGPADAN